MRLLFLTKSFLLVPRLNLLLIIVKNRRQFVTFFFLLLATQEAHISSNRCGAQLFLSRLISLLFHLLIFRVRAGVSAENVSLFQRKVSWATDDGRRERKSEEKKKDNRRLTSATLSWQQWSVQVLSIVCRLVAQLLCVGAQDALKEKCSSGNTKKTLIQK